MGRSLESCRVLDQGVHTTRVGFVELMIRSIKRLTKIPRLNFPGTHRSNNATAYLAPPRNPTDLEQRRRAWWMTLMFDRIVSVGGWPHSIDERDIGTEFPLKRTDFETEVRWIDLLPDKLGQADGAISGRSPFEPTRLDVQ